MILLHFLGFSVGLFLLIKGAGLLVNASSFLAHRLAVPPIIIGLLVVSFGTSLPELLISVTSALQGDTQLAMANVVGSNITNILLVLPAAAIFTPIFVRSNTLWKEIPFSLLAAVVLFLLATAHLLDSGGFFKALQTAQLSGTIGFSAGLILLLFFIIFIFYTFSAAKNEQQSSASKEVKTDISELNQSAVKQILGGIIGLFGLAVGSFLSVENAIVIAHILGVSSGVIGLTVVSLGTSLPELVTSIVAGSKAETELVLGNVVGSNIINIFFVLGLTASVSFIPLTHQNIVDIFVLIGVTISLLLIIYTLGKKHTISKLESSVLLCMYVLYLIWVIFR